MKLKFIHIISYSLFTLGFTSTYADQSQRHNYVSDNPELFSSFLQSPPAETKKKNNSDLSSSNNPFLAFSLSNEKKLTKKTPKPVFTDEPNPFEVFQSTLNEQHTSSYTLTGSEDNPFASFGDNTYPSHTSAHTSQRANSLYDGKANPFASFGQDSSPSASPRSKQTYTSSFDDEKDPFSAFTSDVTTEGPKHQIKINKKYRQSQKQKQKSGDNNHDRIIATLKQLQSCDINPCEVTRYKVLTGYDVYMQTVVTSKDGYTEHRRIIKKSTKPMDLK